MHKYTCTHCGIKYVAKRKKAKDQRTFCSQSCGATFSNRMRASRKKQDVEDNTPKGLDAFLTALEASKSSPVDISESPQVRLRHYPETVIGAGESSSAWAV